MGSVQKRGDGKFQGRYRDGQDQQHSRIFPTWEEADVYWKAGEEMVRTGTHPNGTTVEQFWLEQYRHKFGYFQPGSTGRMHSAFYVHILPRFGPLAFHEIDFEDAGAWKDEMVAAGYAPSYVRENLRLFYAMMTSAAHLGLVEMALVGRMKDEIRKPRLKRKGLAVNPDEIPTPEQVTAWFERMPDYCAAAVMVAAQTGLREGEVLGLSVERLNMLGRKATVDRQLSDSRERGDYMGPTKSEESDRIVVLPPPLLEVLAEHMVRYPPVTRTMDCWDRNNQHHQEEVSLIFNGRHRKILRCSNFSHIANRCSGGFRFHDLRHFFASYMLANSTDMEIWPKLSKMLGHTRLSITQDTYVHCAPQKDEDPQHAVMAKLFGSR